MCVVSHGYDGLGLVKDGGDGWHACGAKPAGSSHIGICPSASQMRVEDTYETRSHGRPGALLWIDSSRNWSVFLERP